MNLALRGHREHMGNGNRHDGNFLALVAMQARFDPVLQDLLQTPARTAGYLIATILTEKCLYQVGQRIKWNNTTRHTTHTIRNTCNIRNTTLVGPMIIMWQARQGPHMIYCLWAPECDATPLLVRIVRPTVPWQMRKWERPTLRLSLVVHVRNLQTIPCKHNATCRNTD